jgi:hypothetical protein
MALSAGIVSTAVLYAFSTVEAAGVAGGGTVLVAGLLYWSFRNKSGISAQPQFTRQSMRERQEGLGDEGSAVGEIDLGAGFGPDVAEDGDDDRTDATAVEVNGGDGSDGGTDIDVTTDDEES